MPNNLNNIKLIIFDVNETMFSLNRISDIFDKFGLPNYSTSIWFSNVLKEGFASINYSNFNSFKKICVNELQRLFLKFKFRYTKEHINKVINEFSQLDVHEDVKESVKLLYKYNIKIVTLTNGSKENTLKLLQKNKLSKYIKRCFSIDEIKLWKPNKKTYLYVCKEMRILPSNTLMIAAHSWDVTGAKNAGLKTAYITRYEKKLSTIHPKPDIIKKDCLSIIKQIKFN
jgi:2-haloacid dehalogenase